MTKNSTKDSPNDPLVSTQWLAAQHGARDLVVLDATYYLPNEDKNAFGEFERAHIPGARFFDIDLFADTDSDLPHMVPSPARFAKLAATLGISNDSRVVFYDQKGLFSAARGWYLCGLFGHDDAFVLDGGLPKWRAEDRHVSDGTVGAALEGAFQATFRSLRLRGVGDMQDNVKTQRELVLDARNAARFTGSQPEPRPGMRSGHIPHSVNCPYITLLNEDGITMQSPERLRAHFASLGVDGGKPVVTSCGSGVTASMLLLGLRHAGLPDGALYDGSWAEWGRRTDTEVAVG